MVEFHGNSGMDNLFAIFRLLLRWVTSGVIEYDFSPYWHCRLMEFGVCITEVESRFHFLFFSFL